MNKRALRSVIKLLEETVVMSDKPEFSCRQLTMVLLCVLNEGMTNTELAERLDLTRGGVSRNYKALGPEGSLCVIKDENGKILPEPKVVEGIAHILDSF